MKKNLIVGAGISGISAGYHLKKLGVDSIIIDKNQYIGGLCNSFKVDDFTFDRFVHFCHTKDEYALNAFSNGTKFICHEPRCSNLYQGKWIKHPVQNNLFPLDISTKVDIIESFINRKDNDEINNYEDWLLAQYGQKFYSEFPLKYTKKYWCHEPSELETKWIGKRMYKPSIREVLEGALTDDTPNTYYADVMRYPVIGGFSSILNYIKEGLSFVTGKKIVEINANRKEVYYEDGASETYDNLISSIPLNKIPSYIKKAPDQVKKAADKLLCTSGYHISVIFKGEPIDSNLWFYVYDENILFSRAYYSSKKSFNNSKDGFSTLQAEVYFLKENKRPIEEIHEKVIRQLIENNIIRKSNYVKSEIHYEEYANVIFDQNIYKYRKIVLDYLKDIQILSVGRFGQWGYYWSDQSFNSSKLVINNNLDLFGIGDK